MIKSILVLFFLVAGVSSSVLASTGMTSPYEQFQSCNSSTPFILNSNMCWGQTSSMFPSAGNYQTSGGGDPFASIALLMQSLNGQMGGQINGQFPSNNADVFAGMNSQPSLLERTMFQNGGLGNSFLPNIMSVK